MKFLFLMDPLETVSFEKDTTFMLMVGAHRRKHDVYYLPKDGITFNQGKLYFDTVRVIPQLVRSRPFILKEKCRLSDSEIQALFIRTDPPFDSEYLIHTWLLDQLNQKVFVINNPDGIRTVNEKLWASQFSSLTPPTLITRRKSDILQFVSQYKKVIAKPVDGHGGKSVFVVAQGDTNTNVIIETLTQNSRKDIIVQKYVSQALEGDKRILLLNGEILGAVQRVHPKGEHRNNLFAGGTAKMTRINKRDVEIVETLKPYLRNLGLYFVGIDIIGNYLIEVNVTSPTCLQEMNKLYKMRLENQVIEFVEGKIENEYA